VEASKKKGRIIVGVTAVLLIASCALVSMTGYSASGEVRRGPHFIELESLNNLRAASSGTKTLQSGTEALGFRKDLKVLSDDMAKGLDTVAEGGDDEHGVLDGQGGHVDNDAGASFLLKMGLAQV
jgi:hypothetical protein